jgi:hypothetical protein
MAVCGDPDAILAGTNQIKASPFLGVAKSAAGNSLMKWSASLVFAVTLSITLAHLSADPAVSDTDDPFVGTASTYDPAIWAAPSKPAKVKLCHPTRRDFRHLFRIVAAGDYPEEIGMVLEDGCCHLSYLDERVGDLVETAISHSRNAVLELLLARLAFDSPREQQDAHGYHLMMALHHSNFEAAQQLLDRLPVVPNYASLWAPPFGNARPWELHRLIPFIYRNRERLPELVPRHQNLAKLSRPEDAILLVELATFCGDLGTRLGIPRLFVPEYFVYQLLRPETRLDDAGRAAVARHLIQAGVNVEEYVGYCGGNPPGLEKTCAVIRGGSAGALKEHLLEYGY